VNLENALYQHLLPFMKHNVKNPLLEEIMVVIVYELLSIYSVILELSIGLIKSLLTKYNIILELSVDPIRLMIYYHMLFVILLLINLYEIWHGRHFNKAHV